MTDYSADELYPPPARRRRKTRWGMVLLVLLAFAAGGGGVGWLNLNGLRLADLVGASRRGANAPAPADLAPMSAGLPASAANQAALETRIIALEQRLARIDLQANAEEANSARAEALLVAFATRRATERGAPLGYLEDQLKLRFGDALPGAVATVQAAQKAPVTLDQLSARLQAMAPALTASPASTSGWESLRGLFVLRRASAPAPTPPARIDHAMLALREGRIDDAIADVSRLPGAAGGAGGMGGGGAASWTASARHYAQVEQALDLLETTALLEPAKLRDGKGHAVTQPSPLVQTTPAPTTPAQVTPAR